MIARMKSRPSTRSGPAGAALAALVCTGACCPAGAQTPDVVVLSAAQTFQHDSNLLRLPAVLSPEEFTGTSVSSRSDLISTTTVGARFDREASLQRLSADARVNFVRYRDYDMLNYDGYNAGGRWDWALGRQWYGQVSARADRYLSSFADVRFARNIVDRQVARLQAGYRLTPGWSAVAALDGLNVNNSSARYARNDLRSTGLEAGARWEPRSGADWNFLWRRSDGKYTNPQVFDTVNDPLPAATGRTYSEDRLFTRAGLQPTDKSRLNGNLGYTRRSYSDPSQRDFAGPSYGLDYSWQGSGALAVSAYVRRDLSRTDVLNAGDADTRVVGVRPTLQFGARTSLEALAEYRRLDYSGGTGFVPDQSGRREDSVTTLSGALSYEVSRKILLSATLRWDRRSSNYERFDYSARVVGVTGEIRY